MRNFHYNETTSNLNVSDDLISQTTTTINAGTKDFILGKEFDGYVKNFKICIKCAKLVLISPGCVHPGGSSNFFTQKKNWTTHLV